MLTPRLGPFRYLYRLNRFRRSLAAALLAAPLAAAGAAGPLPGIDADRLIFHGNQIVLDGIDPDGRKGGTRVALSFQRGGATVGVEVSAATSTDAEGRYTLALDATGLDDVDSVVVTVSSPRGVLSQTLPTQRLAPILCAPAAPASNLEAGIAACDRCGDLFSPELFARSEEAREESVNLVDGTVITRLPILAFKTRMLGFSFTLFHHSLKVCAGPEGQSWSHTYDLAIVRTAADRGYVVTPDLRTFPIERLPSGGGRPAAWSLPEGFFSRLEEDPEHGRWILTHHSGTVFELLRGAPGQPGPLLAVRDPNGNRLQARRDLSGRLTAIATDLDQVVRLAYDDGEGGGGTAPVPGPGRLTSLTDHIGRSWTFGYDDGGNLATVTTPSTLFADVPAGAEVTDSDVAVHLVRRGRTTTLGYDEAQPPAPLGRFPHHLVRITDGRGAVPTEYSYYRDPAEPQRFGRVATETRNGKVLRFDYAVGPAADPPPAPPLEPGNAVTRVVDREGNVTDYEMHGPGGGALGGGRFGLRRKRVWTESGLGRAPLRPAEPAAWEERQLQDSDSLMPKQVSEPFRFEGGELYTDGRGNLLDFDEAGMPLGYAGEAFAYNESRQVTAYERNGVAGERIRWTKTYAPFAAFSRELSYVEPRGFDPRPLYAGLGPQAFTHRYAYDARGNLLRHDAPPVTRGVAGAQAISESWSYNRAGQPVFTVDANGNRTVFHYCDMPSTGGDVNSKKELGGYLLGVTRGFTGSRDPAAGLTTSFMVNALGMVTRIVDPGGQVYDRELNDLGELVREIEPEVTLSNGARVRYETRYVRDGAGHPLLTSRSNVDLDGSPAANPFVDRAQSFDAVGKLLSKRVEIDGDDAHDLLTRYRYDGNDRLAVEEQPEGNRTFQVYDERGLLLKVFYGVARSRSGEAAEGYPADRRSETPAAGTAFVGLTLHTYDARGNRVRTRDGRGHFTDQLFDFADRRVATIDPNGNGATYEYDDSSNLITESGGAVDRETGDLAAPLRRTYYRYDEAGRRYQEVRDVDLTSDESAQVDPDDGQISSLRTVFDAGGRVSARLDANGNRTATTYDAANRAASTTDALGNVRAFAYDANSNLIREEELELPGPGAVGSAERYATTSVFDALNRRTETHVLGRDGNALDHRTLFAYDSRHNLRRTIDAEGRAAVTTFDDHDRRVREQRFDADPFAGAASELSHLEHAYDGNGRKTIDLARSDATDAGSAQATRYTYDDFDRLLTTVYPDADDPAAAGDDCAGPFDGVRRAYDATSNLTTLVDQRGVVFTNAYDDGNRLASQRIALPPCVPGTTRQELTYDALDRLTDARNDYARVLREYDPLSRLTAETQRIRLDGGGFTPGRGWQGPVRVESRYDRQSNRTALRVVSGPLATAGAPDLDVESSFDPLNRTAELRASYFDRPLHPIAAYAYLGPTRLQRKTLGNGAFLAETYDGKRRLAAHLWSPPGGAAAATLPGFEYAYDDVDKPLFERSLHDAGRFDSFGYDARDEVTGADYRAAVGSDYRVDPPAYGTTYAYDSLFNRTAARFSDAFGRPPLTVDTYAIDRASEYVSIERTVGALPLSLAAPRHDAAGNMTALPVRPASGVEAGRDVLAHAVYDAFNRPFSIQAGVNRRQDYRYDALGRRIATLETSGTAAGLGPTLDPGSRRFVWDGWNEVAERRFQPGATLSHAPSTSERVYVQGPEIDELLLTAVDGDGDGLLDGTPEHPRNAAGGPDFEYYALANRMGSVAALLDAGDGARVLESYRYTVYGEVKVLSSLAPAGAAYSPAVNPFLFTGRRLDAATGLYYFRMRFYEPAMGRFVSRDPLGWWSEPQADGNPYDYVENDPTDELDPQGEWSWKKAVKSVGGKVAGGVRKGIESVKGAGEAAAGAAKQAAKTAAGWGVDVARAGAKTLPTLLHWGKQAGRELLAGLLKVTRYGRYCGPGDVCPAEGECKPIDNVDSCCKAHDECYERGGISFPTRRLPWNLPKSIPCDAALCYCLTRSCPSNLHAAFYRLGAMAIFC
jgi:RHS repeat-associated protein